MPDFSSYPNVYFDYLAVHFDWPYIGNTEFILSDIKWSKVMLPLSFSLWQHRTLGETKNLFQSNFSQNTHIQGVQLQRIEGPAAIPVVENTISVV